MSVQKTNAPRLRLPQTSAALHRLSWLAPLDVRSRDLILGLGGGQYHPAGTELTGERVFDPRPRFVISGWAAQMRWLPDGRRQIFNFILPGEGILLSSQPDDDPPQMTVVALTRVQTVDAAPVHKAILSGDPAFADLKQAVRAAERVERLCLLAQVMRLGRQTAYERIAHLLLELRDRMVASGLGTADRFPMPLTQEAIADAVGLSIVHVNRTLQQIKREGFGVIQAGEAHLSDPSGLALVADFESAFPPRDAGGGRLSAL